MSLAARSRSSRMRAAAAFAGVHVVGGRAMIPAIESHDLRGRMNRRGFLKTTLWGGIILAGAGTGLALWPTEIKARPRRALRTTDEREFAILAAVAARTVTAPGADHVEVAHRVDELIGLQCAEAKADFKKLLRLFDNALAGLIFDGRPKPFTRLSPADQDTALIAWRESRQDP